MNRINLTDGSGAWFDLDKATQFDELTRWDGNNHISVVAGGKFEHERLYTTASGRWILQHWSQWQGSQTTYTEIDEEQAIRWLSICGHEHPGISGLEI